MDQSAIGLPYPVLVVPWTCRSGWGYPSRIGVLGRAAKAAGLRHVVWSTLEDTRELLPLDDDRMPVLLGTYNVRHVD